MTGPILDRFASLSARIDRARIELDYLLTHLRGRALCALFGAETVTIRAVAHVHIRLRAVRQTEDELTHVALRLQALIHHALGAAGYDADQVDVATIYEVQS